MELLPIPRDGRIDVPAGTRPQPLQEVLDATVGLYASAGFEPPWICYLAYEGGQLVGTCGYKGPPNGGRVEIAYFTFPPNEGRGLATAMARELVRIAGQADPRLVAFAQTLPGRNASHRVLEKAGFEQTALVTHPEDGLVQEWQRTTATAKHVSG
jgi:RimJ/RimL family protein N-acetyltransferase